MKIELKNIKTNLTFSEETTMFKADLYIDNTLEGYASNEGHGGPTCIYKTPNGNWDKIHAAMEFCKGLPPVKSEYFPEGLEMDLEMYLDTIIEKEVEKKEIARIAKKLEKDLLKGICYGTNTSYTLLSWKGHTMASLLSNSQGKAMVEKKVAELRANNETILNPNL